MTAIIILLVLFCILGKMADSFEKNREKRDRERIKCEQKRMQEELIAQRKQAQEWYMNQVKLEREQLRQAKELAKHEKWLQKHDEEIDRLKFRMNQAESDIEHWKEQLGNLYALLDVAQNELEQSDIGEKNQAKCQKQIISLTNQIHSAENKLSKAEFDRDQAKRKLVA